MPFWSVKVKQSSIHQSLLDTSIQRVWYLFQDLFMRGFRAPIFCLTLWPCLPILLLRQSTHFGGNALTSTHWRSGWYHNKMDVSNLRMHWYASKNKFNLMTLHLGHLLWPESLTCLPELSVVYCHKWSDLRERERCKSDVTRLQPRRSAFEIGSK
jgi:hypothetical protein